jgi:hypothetical protein
MMIGSLPLPRPRPRKGEVHDSIEDARTALHLYEVYHKLPSQEAVQATLQKLYAYGQAHDFKFDASAPFARALLPPAGSTSQASPKPTKAASGRWAPRE